MDLYNFFVNGYNLLRNRKYIPMRLFSPARYLWREIASKILPLELKKTFINNNISASDFLKKNNLNKNLIISFTSFPQRINKVYQVVESISRQTILPDKIILYLSEDQFKTFNDIPLNLRNRISDIFQIKLVKGDLRSYKKFFYSFKDYPNDLVLLIDDDIYYPTDMIEVMLKTFLNHPNSIICRFGYKISFNKDGSLKPYIKWPLIQECSDSEYILFGTGGGSLFEPCKMYKDTCNETLFTELCPIADDIWINAMVRLANLKIKKLDCGGLLPIQNSNTPVLYKENVLNGKNDIQINNINHYYKINYNKLVFSRNEKKP